MFRAACLLILVWVSSVCAGDDLFAAPVEVSIDGPESVQAGSGLLVRLHATGIQDGEQVTWLPVAPVAGFDDRRHFLEDDGRTFGCAVPCGATTIRVQLIAWGSQQWAFHEVDVTDSDGDDSDGDGDDSDIDPIPREQLVIFIIHESRDRGPDLGDEWSELQRDPSLSQHSLAIIDEDQDGLLGQYVARVTARPGIVIDEDWDAGQVLFTGPCPETAAGVKSLIERFSTAPPAAPTPAAIDTGTPSGGVGRSGTPSQPETSAAPIPKKKRSRYVWRTEPDGTRWGVDTQTGKMYPVNESTRTFCVEGRCFRVPPPR